MPKAIAWYLRPWKLMFQVRGRARRREVWAFVLGNLLVYLALVSLLVLFSSPSPEGTREDVALLNPPLLALFIAFGLGVLIAGTTLAVRRLHDLNLSGLWYLLVLVPLLGFLLNLVLAFLPGNPGENRFGPPPGLDP